MAKLRDWWPSEELSSQATTIAAAAASSPSSYWSSKQFPTTVPASATRANNTVDSTEIIASKSKHQLRPSPPAFKLANKQRLKEELLQQLLHSCAAKPDPPASTPSSPPVSSGTTVAPIKKLPVRNSFNGVLMQKQQQRQQQQEQQQQQQQQSQPSTPKSAMSRREIHIYSERERRKGMTHLYSTLHSLLPGVKPKADRCSVLTEAMEYIEELRGRLEDLAKHKKELTGCSLDDDDEEAGGGGGGSVGEVADGGGGAAAAAEISEEERAELLRTADVSVRFAGRDAFVTLNGPKRRGLWPRLLQMLMDAQLELLNVTLSSSLDIDYHCVHARMESTTSKLRSQELQKTLQDLVISFSLLE